MSYDSLGGESFFHPWKILYRSNKKNGRTFLWQVPHEKRFVKNISHHSQCIKNELYPEVTLGLCNFIQNQSRILKFRCIFCLTYQYHLCKLMHWGTFWIKNDSAKYFSYFRHSKYFDQFWWNLKITNLKLPINFAYFWLKNAHYAAAVVSPQIPVMRGLCVTVNKGKLYPIF